VHPYEVLRRPVITEKNTGLQSLGKYAFEVAERANKQQIKQAVESAFGVKVVSVNVVRVRGKTRLIGRRPVLTQSWKKAIVSLQPGDSIQFFAGV
jgi:large subunit ribosomal protein L23